MENKLLIVDDEDMIREVLNITLTGNGYKVDEAVNGKSALKLMEKNKYDMVLTDIVMPGMNGLELTQKVVEKYAIPVIILTAYGTFDYAVEAINCGAFNFVSKPFDNDQLLKIVKKGLKLPSLKAGQKLIIPYQKHEIEFSIPGDLELIDGITYQIVRTAEASGFSPKESSLSILLTVDELLQNAIEHGNKNDRDKKIYISTLFDSEKFEMTIRDEGEGFNTNLIKDKFDPDGMEQHRVRGILLVKHYMSNVEYAAKGNEVTVSLLRGK